MRMSLSDVAANARTASATQLASELALAREELISFGQDS